MILVCFGTRPEYIKIKPLLKKMDGVIPYKILFTGQHEDLLQDINCDYRLNIEDGKNRLDCLIKSVMDNINFEGISHVLVQGDTATAFSIALSAFHNQIDVIHLEAGMRTFDKYSPFPEEIYRQCISKIANIHFAPSEYEADILEREGCGSIGKNIHVVGNTVLDNLVGQQPTHKNIVLLTMHRRENHKIIPEYFKLFSELAKENWDLRFILPLHPNPDVSKHKHLLENIIVTEPLHYDDMISMISNCRFIISDSGGIQEEASFLKKKVIVCRDNTERVATLNKNCFLCTKPSELRNLFNTIKDDYIVSEECPYGDGHSSDKIVEILKCVV